MEQQDIVDPTGSSGSTYLSDGSEAGQRPQAAAVCDDHGLGQQTGRMVLGRV